MCWRFIHHRIEKTMKLKIIGVFDLSQFGSLGHKFKNLPLEYWHIELAV